MWPSAFQHVALLALLATVTPPTSDSTACCVPALPGAKSRSKLVDPSDCRVALSVAEPLPLYVVLALLTMENCVAVPLPLL